MILNIIFNTICSDDETVDVAGSEEEETDSEREPSAEVISFFHPFLSYTFISSYHIILSCEQEPSAEAQ